MQHKKQQMQQPKKRMLSNNDPRYKEEAADLAPLSSTKGPT
jgi:hypothetical protein